MKFVLLTLIVVLIASLISLNSHSVVNAEKLPYTEPKNMKAVKAGDDVYIIFEATNNNSSKQDIYLSASHNAGKNYSTINLSNGEVVINASKNENATEVEESFDPQIALDKEGDVYVAWNAKQTGNTNYVVLAYSEDKFATPVVPFVNMTNPSLPGTELSLIKDETTGAVNLFYLTEKEGPADPCKTRCG